MKALVVITIFTIISINLAWVSSSQVSNLEDVSSQTSPYNQINHNFTYPESTLINFSQANIPYQGKAYSGYLTVNPVTQSKIFYIVYPAGGAQNSQATLNNTAPLILWLQGGPGCADGVGNYQEIGPYMIVNQSGVLTPVLQEISWNDEYNLLFVDSPAGVGYSVTGNETYTSGYQVSEFLQVFLIRFFEIYTSLAANDFYIFGESYGGHYVPALATIIMQNVSQNGINIKGIGVGNGCTDVYHQGATTSDIAFSFGLLDEYNRDQIVLKETQMKQLVNSGNLTAAAILLAQIEDMIGQLDFNINQYNFEQYEPQDPEISTYEAWLDLKMTKMAYGVDPNVTYIDCANCESDFMADFVSNYALNYTYLLSQTVIPDFKVLIYGGQNDMACNNLGVQLFLKTLGWTGTSGFINSKKQILKDENNNVVGNYKNYDRFTFAIIYAAGHMSPLDNPASARLVLKYFMEGLFA